MINTSQVVGYTIALCGLVLYSLGWETILGLWKTTVATLQEIVFEYELEGWRGTLLTLVGAVVVFLYVVFVTNSVSRH